jgi:hypothetical protein
MPRQVAIYPGPVITDLQRKYHGPLCALTQNMTPTESCISDMRAARDGCRSGPVAKELIIKLTVSALNATDRR